MSFFKPLCDNLCQPARSNQPFMPTFKPIKNRFKYQQNRPGAQERLAGINQSNKSMQLLGLKFHTPIQFTAFLGIVIKIQDGNLVSAHYLKHSVARFGGPDLGWY